MFKQSALLVLGLLVACNVFGEVSVSGSGKGVSLSNGLTKVNVVLKDGDAIGFEVFSVSNGEKEVALVELSSSARWKAKTVESGKKGTGCFFTFKGLDTSGTKGTPEFGPGSYITVSLDEGNPFPQVEFKFDVKSFDSDKWESAWGGKCPMYFLRCTLDEAQCFYQGGELYPSPTYDPYPITMPQMSGDWSKDRWSYAPAIGANPVPAMGLWAPQIKKFVGYEFQNARSTDKSDKFIASSFCAGEDAHPKQFFTLLYPYAKGQWRKLAYPKTPVTLNTRFRMIYNLDIPSYKDPNDWVIHYIYKTYADILPACPKMNDLSWMKATQGAPDEYGALLLYDIGMRKSRPMGGGGNLFVKYDQSEKQFFNKGATQMIGHQIGKAIKYAYLVNNQGAIKSYKDQIEFLIPMAIEKTYENGDKAYLWNHPLEGSFNNFFKGEAATSTQHMFNWSVAEVMLYIYMNEKDERFLKYIDGMLLWTKHYLYDRAGMADIPQSIFSMGAGNGGEFCLDYYYAFRNDPVRGKLAKEAFDLAKMVVFRNVYYYTDDPDESDLLDPAFLFQAVNAQYWLGMVTWGEMGRIPEMLMQIYAETGDPVAKYITRGCLEKFYLGARNTKLEFWENVDIFGESNGEKGKGSGGWGASNFKRYAQPLGDAVMRIVMGQGGAMAFCVKTFAVDIADYCYEPESNFEFRVVVDRSLAEKPGDSFSIIATAPRRDLRGKKVFINGKEVSAIITTVGEDVYLTGVKDGDIVTVGEIKLHKPLKLEQEKARVAPKDKYVKDDAFALLNLYPLADVKVDATWQGDWGGYVPGKEYYSGIPCLLMDPALNSGKIGVSGGTQVPVGEKAKAIFVFASTQGKTGKIGDYTITFADGTTQNIELTGGLNAFSGSPYYKKEWVVKMYPGFLTGDKVIKSISFSKGSMVLAVTLHLYDTDNSIKVLDSMKATSLASSMAEGNYNYQVPEKKQLLDLAWWNKDWHYRSRVELGAGDADRADPIIRIKEDFSLLLGQAGITAALDTNSVRVVEYDAAGKVINEIPAQFDSLPGDPARGEVVWIAPGKMKAGDRKNFCIYFDTVKNPKKSVSPGIKYSVDSSLLTVETGKGGVKLEFSLDPSSRGPRLESVIFDNENNGNFDNQQNALGPTGYNEGYGDLTQCQDPVCWYNFGGLQESPAVADVVNAGPVSLTVKVSNKELYGGGKGQLPQTKVVGYVDWFFRFYKGQKRIDQWVNVNITSGSHKWTRDLQVRLGLNTKEGVRQVGEGGVFYAMNEEVAAVVLDDEQNRKKPGIVFTEDGGVIAIGFDRYEKAGSYYPGRWFLLPGGQPEGYYASQAKLFPFMQYGIEILGASGAEKPDLAPVQSRPFDSRFEVAVPEVTDEGVSAAPAKPTFSDSAYLVLGKKDVSFGLKRKDNPDEGRSKGATMGGRDCGVTGVNPAGSGRLFYFDVDDNFITNANWKKVEMTVEYYDSGSAVGLEYDSTDESVQKCPIAGAFKDYAEKIEAEGSEKWRTFTFRIDDARFGNSCNGADFRFSSDADFYISKITIIKIK